MSLVAGLGVCAICGYIICEVIAAQGASKIKIKKGEERLSSHKQANANRLKCFNDSPDWISMVVASCCAFVDLPPTFESFAPSTRRRRFLALARDVGVSSSSPSPSRHARFFCRYSARILAASSTRETDFGMPSVLPAPGGARSVSLGK